MFIDSTQIIMNQFGKSFKRPLDPEARPRPGAEEPEQVPLTLGYVIVEAILTPDESGKLEASKHLDRYLLAQKFVGALLPVEVNNSEADMIKDLVARRWQQSIQIAGQAVQMIKKSPDAPPASTPVATPAAANAA